MRNEKGNILVIVLSGFLLLAIGAAGFFFWQNQLLQNVPSNPYPTNNNQVNFPTPSAQDATANWKTYTNEKWSYSFKYPPSWILEGDNNDDTVGIESSKELVEARNKWDTTTNGPFINPYKDYASVGFSVYANGTKTQVETISDQTNIKTFVPKFFNLNNPSEDISLGGKPAVSYTTSQGSKYIWMKIPGGLLYTSYVNGSDYKDISKLPKLFDQVLSTFKFLDQPNSGSTVSNSFDVLKAKVGDKVGQMTVSEIGPFMKDRGAMSVSNATALFSGPVTISGQYSSASQTALGLTDGKVCFTVKDNSSLMKLPENQYDKSMVWFCFDNNQYAIDNLGPIDTSGNATIEIDNYRVNYFPAEVYNTAKLTRVVQKS